jgi:hypothetical protein
METAGHRENFGPMMQENVTMQNRLAPISAILCLATISYATFVLAQPSPQSPAGKESNWVQTWPGKGWNVILRLYGPLQPWFDKTWRPGESEEVQ